MDSKKYVLVTGGNGYLGQNLIKSIHSKHNTISFDVKEIHENKRIDKVVYLTGDIRDQSINNIFEKYSISTVVHLAAIVVPPKSMTEQDVYEIDVDGTKKILELCVQYNVQQIVISSSGASYGYYHDNPEWIDENSEIRGNDSFAYSRNKRLVEEILAEYRNKFPKLKQCIFRIGTILGENTNNQITNLFHKKISIGILGSESPFVFIWDQDVVQIFSRAIELKSEGIFNVAGDGKLSMKQIAKITNQIRILFPAWFLKMAIAILNFFKLTQYTTDQIDFLRYRPVLSNQKLKNVFGYTPLKTSEEVFKFYWESKKSAI
ncbi:NAD-dependent epimerase/dehydratase family protein [Leptospira sp. GIMC2001]|uniref:NAD-dependent epimerase/dehydratase family protein n=1 Tax=Leptospira sp. GIMC2001 TaxID=1513297 RepID=UPI002349890C|nr:NAD-dependent epimerase/dehydratase family protein [Leptospira sp. GIMC2001]WCL50593.1 NAD-dependent epimerase/dehydratase family protein [Leptospira sp. GIMC2001]